MPEQDTSPGINRMMRLQDVQVTISYSSSQIYRMIKAGLFPRPLRLGPGRVGWRRSAVEALVATA